MADTGALEALALYVLAALAGCMAVAAVEYMLQALLGARQGR